MQRPLRKSAVEAGKRDGVSTHGDVAGRHLDRIRRHQVEEAVFDLGGSLNVRRTALQLARLVQPDLADWVMVVVADGETGQLLMLGEADPAGVVIGRDDVDGSALGRVLRSGHTEQVDGSNLKTLVPVDPFLTSATALKPAEAVALGLTARGGTVGALVMLRRAAFDSEEVAFAERIASRSALALDSARLYEERSRTASVLQHSLRLPALPDIPGVRLAARHRAAFEDLEIGGDFYDVVGRDDDWLIAIGDVCGKGVEAAAVAGQTRQIIRTAAHFDHEPAAVLSATNSVLHDVLYNSMTTQFVTVLCARLRPVPDKAAANVDLATAGHHAPLLLRADGLVERVDVYGTAAGVVADLQYGTRSVCLDAGDTMLMFTDGIDEAWGEAGEYGMERLHALLPPYAGAPPETLCEAVEQDVMEYLGGRAHDDMALLAVTCLT